MKIEKREVMIAFNGCGHSMAKVIATPPPGKDWEWAIAWHGRESCPACLKPTLEKASLETERRNDSACATPDQIKAAIELADMLRQPQGGEKDD